MLFHFLNLIFMHLNFISYLCKVFLARSTYHISASSWSVPCDILGIISDIRFFVNSTLSLVLFHVSSDTALAPGILLLTPWCRFWICAAATAWLGLALAAFRAFHAVFASPSQDILSGI